MQEYKEMTMERLNSGESKMIFRNISSIVFIGLTVDGKHAWQQEEDTREYTSTVLMLQEQFFNSELFNVIQDAISLILLDRTMYFFRTTSSSTFIMSDVQSISFPSSILDWYLEVKIWVTDRQTVFSLLVDPVDKKPSGSWYDRLECTASCTTHA